MLCENYCTSTLRNIHSHSNAEQPHAKQTRTHLRGVFKVQPAQAERGREAESGTQQQRRHKQVRELGKDCHDNAEGQIGHGLQVEILRKTRGPWLKTWRLLVYFGGDPARPTAAVYQLPTCIMLQWLIKASCMPTKTEQCVCSSQALLADNHDGCDFTHAWMVPSMTMDVASFRTPSPNTSEYSSGNRSWDMTCAHTH